MLSWVFKVLADWNNSPRVDMSLHPDTLSRFRANQSLFNVACGEAANTNVIVFSLTRPGLEHTIYRIRGEHVNHYTTDAVLLTSYTFMEYILQYLLSS
jgi:hypothetical protein